MDYIAKTIVAACFPRKRRGGAKQRGATDKQGEIQEILKASAGGSWEYAGSKEAWNAAEREKGLAMAPYNKG